MTLFFVSAFPHQESYANTISIPYMEQATLEDKSSIMGMNYTCKEKLGDNLVYITTDKEHYDTGNSIIITGCASDATNFQDLNLQIIDSENNIVRTSAIIPEANSLFHMEYIIHDKFGGKILCNS